MPRHTKKTISRDRLTWKQTYRLDRLVKRVEATRGGVVVMSVHKTTGRYNREMMSNVHVVLQDQAGFFKDYFWNPKTGYWRAQMGNEAGTQKWRRVGQ